MFCPVDRWWYVFFKGFYAAFLSLLWPVLLLVYRLKSTKDGRYKNNYPYRMGLKEVSFPPGGERIWIHALSVGETLSVVPFVKALHRSAPHVSIVFSSATQGGRDMAEKHLKPYVRQFFFMPHDFPWLARKYVLKVRPKMFILVETDVWPNFLFMLRGANVCSVLLNGRISETSFKRLKPWKSVLKPIYESFDWIFTQSEMDKRRFEILGGQPERVQARGNVKFDASFQDISGTEKETLRLAVGMDPDRLMWVAGSTHEGEEELLLRAHGMLRETFPDLLLLLAPRQIRRAHELAAMAGEHGFRVGFRSRGEGVRGKDVFLLDTLGELNKFYAPARGAFIGGSLIPFGGHNPLEAVAHGIPAFWGPHLFNFREIEDLLLREELGSVISSAEELKEKLKVVFADWDGGGTAQEKTATFRQQHLGASEDIARFLLDKLGFLAQHHR